MAGALIGALRVSLSAETSAFEAGMKRSQAQASKTASSIQGSFAKAQGAIKAGVAGLLSGISVGLILQAGRSALEYASSLGEMAEQLGVTSKELQVYRFIASQTGVSQESMDKGLARLTLTIGKAAAGSKQAQVGFEALGLSVRNADGSIKTAGQLLPEIADKYKNIDSAATRAALTFQFFGKAGQNLSRILSGGSAEINELSLAAEKLGIVLSSDQIERADETADKLEALSTALKARIAGEVADNANAIYQFAEALFDLANRAMQAKNALAEFTKNYNLVNLLGANQTFGFNRAGRSVTTKIGQGGTAEAEARRRGLKLMSDVPRTPGGGDPGQFLAGDGGSKHKTKADHTAEKALREANQFDQDIRRAKIDVLNATRDLATDAIERYNISIQIKDAEDAAFEAELKYQQNLYKLTNGQDGLSATQAEELKAQHDIVSSLERKKLIADEQHRAFEESARLDDLQFNLERDRLQSEAQLAETASEQRDVQLRLLDLSYRQERARLQTIIADEQSSEAAKEEARRRLLNLSKTFGNDRQSVINNTRGPLEDLFSQLPTDAKKLNEALESVAANGLKSIEDGLVDVITGTKSVKEAFHEMAAQILAELLRIAIQKYIIGTIMKVAGLGMADGGEVPGFAYGGFVSGPGGPRADRVPAMLSAGEFVVNAKATRAFLPLLKRINEGSVGHFATGGLAIPRASYDSRAGVSNDNGHGWGMPSVVMHNDFRGADPNAVASIKAHLDQLEQRLPGQIVSTVQDARSRFIIR